MCSLSGRIGSPKIFMIAGIGLGSSGMVLTGRAQAATSLLISIVSSLSTCITPGVQIPPQPSSLSNHSALAPFHTGEQTEEATMSRHIGFLGIGIVLLALTANPSPASSQVWEQICSEGTTCPVSGTRPVRYGADGRFNYGVASGSVHCSDRTFGDPTANRSKSCYAYFTADEIATRHQIRNKDERIRALEQEIQATRAELDEANAELEDLYREFRRERRRPARPERQGPVRRDQFGPFIIERR
jgi:hypothetical protein